MTKEFCLVEVAVRFFKTGDPFWSDQLGETLWKTEPQVAPIKTATNEEPAFWGPFQVPEDIYFETDNCSFSFRTFGQSASGDWSNPFDWIIDAIGKDEVFKDWLPDLEKLALSILGEANKKRIAQFRPEELSSFINFVTTWQYKCQHFPETSYAGEDYDEEWELIGAVDLYKIPLSIMKTEDE